MIRFHRKASAVPGGRLALYPGSFNPPTRAHLNLAAAALESADEVLFLLPASFPHKTYEGASLTQRLELLDQALPDGPYSIGVSHGGLFVEMAREAREAYGDLARLWVVCGRDAAERVLGWDYGDPDFARRMLNEFQLLVAERNGAFSPPPELVHCVDALIVPPGTDEVSATEVRRRIRSGDESWREWIPPAIADAVKRIYLGEALAG